MLKQLMIPMLLAASFSAHAANSQFSYPVPEKYRIADTTSQIDLASNKLNIKTGGKVVASYELPKYDAAKQELKTFYGAPQWFSYVTVSDKPSGVLFSDKVFAPTSFWYTKIPATAKLATNNDALVKEFQRQVKAYYNNVNINTAQYTSPLFIADAKTPKQDIRYENCQNKSWIDPVFVGMMKQVPIPANAEPATGNDKEMSIYDPTTDTLWETWVTRKDPKTGKWSACWGGRMDSVSKNPGQFRQYFGTTATSLPFVGGQITAAELERGEIKHAIGISLVDIENWHIYSWPASRSDGWNPDKIPNRIEEGRRFRLDPTLDVTKLGLNKAGQTIAKAAQTYGFVVWDKAGAISIRAQGRASYVKDPYPALFGGVASYDVLKNIPWNKLQFMPPNYGKP